MLLVSNSFGGLDNRRGANLIGPNLAADLSNVSLEDQGISPLSGPGATITTLAGTVRSLYKFNGGAILSTEDRQYVEVSTSSGTLLVYCVAGQHPQKSTDGATFHNLGIQAPQDACTAVAGVAGALTGDYEYFVVFTSSVAGGRSGPNPAATVTLASQKGSLTNIPTHLGTGDITSGSPTVANVTHIAAWQVGMRIIGQDASAVSAPAASVGIPAGATITATDTNANTLTLSANATATATGIRLSDPQFTGREIYRVGGSSAVTSLVTTLADLTTTTYTDNTADADVGMAITTLGQEMPAEFAAIAVSPQGVLLGSKGSTLYPSEVGLPWAFSSTSLLANETVVALAHFAGSFVAWSQATVYVLPGTDKTDLYLVTTPGRQGCAERDTLVDMGDVLACLGHEGILTFDARNTVVVSKDFLSDAFMEAISATNAKGARHKERFYLFHSAGWLCWDRRIPGSPWNKGTLGTNEVTAAHYNRTDNALYITVPDGAGTSDMKQWEAGSALTWLYKTGDWHGSTEGLEDFYRAGRLVHNGAITVDRIVDGTTLSPQKSNTRTSEGPFDFWISHRGLRLALQMGGTGSVRAVYADIGKEAQRL